LSTETSEFDYWRIGSHEFGGGGEREVLPNSPIIFYAGFDLLQETLAICWSGGSPYTARGSASDTRSKECFLGPGVAPIIVT
jgi:hypothetical protein